MKLSGIKIGDTIKCNVRGRQFEATVTGTPVGGVVAIQPPRGINYHHVNARQVVGRPARWDPMAPLRCRDA